MNGHQSDLRTGLPLQMVEIHEPMRLLLIVEATPESLLAVAGRQAEVGELVVNALGAARVGAPGDRRDDRLRGRAVRALRAGAECALPAVERSRDWHMQVARALRRAAPSCATLCLESRACSASSLQDCVSLHSSSWRCRAGRMRGAPSVCSRSLDAAEARGPERTTAGLIRCRLARRRRGGGGFLGARRARAAGEVEFGPWLHIGGYEIPSCSLVDALAVAFSLLAAALTALVARFSRTYLHKEPGLRALLRAARRCSPPARSSWRSSPARSSCSFAGWELVGISSALFIGFFHERDEPVRSSVRAFATYRLCDAGLLIATVITHELLGSARLSARCRGAASLPGLEATLLALLFLLVGDGEVGAAARSPGWLPRAMEGPTPSSALFYGGVSIHAGLFLLLRVWPVLEVSPVAGASAWSSGSRPRSTRRRGSRVHPDAKGALAHATLAQVGLILAEISAG